MSASEDTRVSVTVRWLAVVAVAGVILYASVIRPPTGGLGGLGPFGLVRIDKYAHAAAYAGLAASLVYALAPSRLSEPAVLAVAFGLAVGYGLGVEVLQLAVPARRFDAVDVLANAAGTAVAVGMWRAVTRRRGRRAVG